MSQLTRDEIVLEPPTPTQSAKGLSCIFDGNRAFIIPYNAAYPLPKVEHRNCVCMVEGFVTSMKKQSGKENRADTVEVFGVTALSFPGGDGALTTYKGSHKMEDGYVSGELRRMSPIQVFERGNPTVFLSLRMGAANGTPGKTITVLLQGEATSWRPFLHIGEHYSISGLKERRLRDRNAPDAVLHAFAGSSVTFKTLKFLWNHELVDSISHEELAKVRCSFSLDQKACLPRAGPGSDLGRSEVMSNFSPSPEAVLRLSQIAVDIDVTVATVCNSMVVVVMVEGANAAESRTLSLFAPCWRDVALSSSIRTGAKLRAFSVYPVFLWGVLRGFYVCAQSHLRLIHFSDRNSPGQLSVGCPVPRLRYTKNDKCVMYQAWEHITVTEIHQGLGLLFPADAKAVFSLVERILQCATDQSMLVSYTTTQKEFVEDAHISLMCVRAGYDTDYLGMLLPACITAKFIEELTWQRLQTFLDSGNKASPSHGGFSERHVWSHGDLCRLAVPSVSPMFAPVTLYLVGVLVPCNPRHGETDRCYHFLLKSHRACIDVYVPEGISKNAIRDHKSVAKRSSSDGALVALKFPTLVVMANSAGSITRRYILVEASGVTGSEGSMASSEQGAFTGSVKRRREEGSESDTLRSDCLGIRSALMLGSEMIHSHLIGVVVYMSPAEESNTSGVGKVGIDIRDVLHVDFVRCYCDANLVDDRSVIVGAVVTIVNGKLAWGHSGRPYLVASNALRSSVRVARYPDMTDVQALTSLGLQRPDMLHPPLKSLLSDPSSIAEGARPPSVTVSDISCAETRVAATAETGARSVAWSVRGHCVHINVVEVTVRCVKCGYPAEKVLSTGILSQFVCPNKNCVMFERGHLLGESKRVSWEVQAKFDDGTGEAIVYLHDDDFFAAVAPSRPETSGCQQALARRDGTAYEYASRRFETMMNTKSRGSGEDCTSRWLQDFQRLREYLEKAALLCLGKVECFVQHKQDAEAWEFPDLSLVALLDRDALVENCRKAVSLILGKARHRQVHLSMVVRIVNTGRAQRGNHGQQQCMTRPIHVQQLHESKWWHQSQTLPTLAPRQVRLRVLRTEQLTLHDQDIRAYEILRHL